MDYISLCRWLCIIALLFLFFALPRACSWSITLEESLQHALSHNEDLLIAREDLEKSRQRVRHAVADVLPQLDITMQYTRNWLLPTFFFDTPAGQQQFTVGAHNNLIGTVGIRQSVWGGGKSFSALRAARLFRQFSDGKGARCKATITHPGRNGFLRPATGWRTHARQQIFCGARACKFQTRRKTARGRARIGL